MVNTEINKSRLLGIINKDSRMTITELSGMLKVNKMYLSGYLKALEDTNLVKSKKIGPSLVYCINRG